jgi:hypothetical protein
MNEWMNEWMNDGHTHEIQMKIIECQWWTTSLGRVMSKPTTLAISLFYAYVSLACILEWGIYKKKS